jgi:mono/diheme cytochrome c family protein
VILAITITFTVGWRPFLGPRHRALTSRQFESTAQRHARGEYLVQNVTGCAVCHSVRDFTKHDDPVTPGTLLAGSHIDDPGMPGTVYAPNLTSDPETGAASWSDDQLARAIREGIGHDGRALFPMMPYMNYRSLSDEDLESIIVYLRSVPPIVHSQPQTKLNFPVNLLIRSVPVPLTEPVAEPDRSTSAQRGAYLVKIAVCADCHTPSNQKGDGLPGMEFSGGSTFTGNWGSVASANITPDPSGIPYYDEKQFIQVVRTGFVGARKLNQIMPWSTYRGMTDADLADIFAYLKTLKPVRHHVDNSLPATFCKLCRQRHGGGDQN